MTTPLPLETDELLVRALGDACRALLGDVIIAPGYTNHVSRPVLPDYVLITPMTMTRQATNVHVYRPETGSEDVRQSTRRRVQIDLYGGRAAEWAITLSAILRDAVGVRLLAPYGVTPLYVDDPQDMTQPEGNEQYNRRWMLGLMVQTADTVTVPLDYFHNVDLSLHPQA